MSCISELDYEEEQSSGYVRGIHKCIPTKYNVCTHMLTVTSHWLLPSPLQNVLVVQADSWAWLTIMLLTSKTPFRSNLPWHHNGAILIGGKWFVVPPLNWVLNKEYFYHHPSYISSKLISYLCVLKTTSSTAWKTVTILSSLGHRRFDLNGWKVWGPD